MKLQSERMVTLTAALRYAARGQRVLAIEPRGKKPLVEHGVYDATTDADTILAWWTRWPNANVAIAVPHAYRVLDVDTHGADGPGELSALEARHGALPPTIMARTGSGGEHRLFVFPAGVYRGRVVRGLDLLGPGRFYLAAPSLHPCGQPYRWMSTKGMSIASAPPWLVDLSRAERHDASSPFVPSALAEPSVIERARAYLAKCEPAISGSGGHNVTLRTAVALVRGFALDEGTALALLVDWNRCCEPPWSRHELVHKIKEAGRVGRMVPGALRDRPRRSA